MSVVDSEIGAIFVPVSNVEAARDWYCRLLKREPIGDIEFGHLYVMPMRAGTALVLDSKDFHGPHDRKPAFHFNTADIQAAREHVLAVGARNVTEVSNGVFFNFQDPDGNLLMVADVPPAPKLEP